MTKADDAYNEAERRIADALDRNALSLDIEDLETIPPEIAGLTSLSTLDLHNTQITDLSPLSTLSDLHILYFYNTQFSDLAPLSKLTSLTELHLDSTQITDLAPLSTHKHLTYLNLDYTQITDLRPIKNLENLVSDELLSGLHFHDTPATRLDPELERLSDITNAKDRTRQTLDYLKSLKDWPPVEAMPEDKPLAPKYIVPDNGPIQAAGDPIGPNDPEQQALQDECREKVRTLIGSVREGDNELAPFLCWTMPPNIAT